MRFISLTFLVILLNSSIFWLTNRPQDAGPDVPNGKLNSLSFAPYREGQSPLNETFPSVEQIDADLQLMAQKTHSIRTYASAEGNMPAISDLAGKRGLKMIQGAWLTSDAQVSQKEVEAVIKSANTHPDVVKRVIVGNEVLLRGELTADEIIQYIRAVKKAIKQPVSYADVWSMYMKNPEIIKEVDFITIHILPYWEDEPIAVEDAPAHIERIYRHVRQEADSIAPGKPILIGESGWPSHGRQRGWALPGVVNEAKFIRGLLSVANKNGFDCNIVEAINQSWKSELEGVVGASWGLYSTDRKEVFPLTGKVYENPEWPKLAIMAAVFMLLTAFIFKNQLTKLPAKSLAIFLLTGQLFSSLLAYQVDQLWYVSFTHWQRAWTVLVIAFNVATGGFLLQRIVDVLSGKTHPALGSKLYTLYFVTVAYAIFKTLALAIDGRYLSFPYTATYIPVTGIAVLSLIYYLYSPKTIALNKTLGLLELPQPWRKQSLIFLAGLLLFASAVLIKFYLYANTIDYPAIALFLPLAGMIAFLCKRLPELSSHDYGKYAAYLLLFVAAELLIGETLAFFISRDLIATQPDALTRLYWSAVYTLSNGQLQLWLLFLVILAVPLLVENNETPVQSD